MLNILDLNAMDDASLRQKAEGFSIRHADKLSRQDLIYKILDAQAIQRVSQKAENPRVEAQTPVAEEPAVEEPVKRKRGRPKRNPDAPATPKPAPVIGPDGLPVPRKRGRPKKKYGKKINRQPRLNKTLPLKIQCRPWNLPYPKWYCRP